MKNASLYLRFMAKMIDALLFFVPVFCIYSYDRLVPGSNCPTTLISILMGLAYFVYQVCMHAQFGQSFGKMWAKIEVVRTDGQAISWREAFLRFLVEIVFFAVETLRLFVGTSSIAGILLFVGKLSSPWFMAEIISVLWRDDCRAIHDLMADTIVVGKSGDIPGRYSARGK